jgi:hypothetical protein
MKNVGAATAPVRAALPFNTVRRVTPLGNFTINSSQFLFMG